MVSHIGVIPNSQPNFRTVGHSETIAAPVGRPGTRPGSLSRVTFQKFRFASTAARLPGTIGICRLATCLSDSTRRPRWAASYEPQSSSLCSEMARSYSCFISKLIVKKHWQFSTGHRISPPFEQSLVSYAVMMCGAKGWPHRLQFPFSSSRLSGGTGTIYHPSSKGLTENIIRWCCRVAQRTPSETLQRVGRVTWTPFR